MDTIAKAIPLDDYRIEILTSSGITGVFDVKPYLKGTAFKELTDQAYFRLVRPAHHGIRWPNDQDFSSDTIIWDIKESQQAASAQPAPLSHKPIAHIKHLSLTQDDAPASHS